MEAVVVAVLLFYMVGFLFWVFVCGMGMYEPGRREGAAEAARNLFWAPVWPVALVAKAVSIIRANQAMERHF